MQRTAVSGALASPVKATAFAPSSLPWRHSFGVAPDHDEARSSAAKARAAESPTAAGAAYDGNDLLRRRIRMASRFLNPSCADGH